MSLPFCDDTLSRQSEPLMRSNKPSLFRVFVVGAALAGTAGVGNADVNAEVVARKPVATLMGSTPNHLANLAADAAAIAPTGSRGALSTAAGTSSEEPPPESGLYMMILATLAAMGSVVLRRSGAGR